MHALSTTHPMSKITQSAISQKPIDQKEKKKFLFWTIYFYTFLPILSSKFKILIATEAVSTFQHLENQYLTAQQMAHW